VRKAAACFEFLQCFRCGVIISPAAFPEEITEDEYLLFIGVTSSLQAPVQYFLVLQKLRANQLPLGA